MTAPDAPDRGDIIWLRLTADANQAVGQNPVLVISPQAYNQATGLLLACPITSQVKHYPFEVAIAEHFLDGVILADQLQSYDWTDRSPRLIVKTSPQTLASVIAKLQLLIVS